MTWTKLARRMLRFRDRSCVSIRIEHKQRHLPRMFVYVSRKVAVAAGLSFEKNARVSLLLGEGPDAGRLKVMSDPKGEFHSRVRNKERPGVMIAAAAAEGFPLVWKGTQCEPEIGKGWVSFRLPWHTEDKLEASIDALERLTKEDDKAKYWMTPADAPAPQAGPFSKDELNDCYQCSDSVDAQGDDPPLPHPAPGAAGEGGPATMADIVREVAAGQTRDAADAVRDLDGAAGAPAADDQHRGVPDPEHGGVAAGADRGNHKRAHANRLMQAAAATKPAERPRPPVKAPPKASAKLPPKQTVTFTAEVAGKTIEVELNPKPHIVATRLYRAMTGKMPGFLPYDELTQAAGGVTKEYLSVIASDLRRKLEPEGLTIEAVPRMGFVMRMKPWDAASPRYADMRAAE